MALLIKSINILRLFMFSLFSSFAFSASVPVLLYSDITAGPNNGWSANSPNKGAVVTIWGRNLGLENSMPEQSGNYVTVNGIQLKNNADYAEPWGQDKPVPGIQRISFWLTKDMPEGDVEISVTVKGVESNKLPFRINDGKLYFIDINNTELGDGSHEKPFQKPGSAFSLMKAGDILYFREGLYNKMYWGGGENIWVREGAPDGTRENPIAFVAYPNESPFLDSLSAMSSSFHTGIRIDSPWYTVSKFKIEAYASGIIAGHYARIVGNDVDGGNVFRFGIGVITGTRNGVKIYGNSVHGGSTGNRLDHAIYLSGCAPDEGMEVGWNYIHENNFGSGPMIVVNHQDTRCPSNVRLASHKIFSNFINCETFPSRAIGLYHQSWDPLTDSAGEPLPTYVFNNIIYSCGDAGEPVMYQNSAHGRWFNNIMFNSLGNGMSVAGNRVISTEIKNNIFHQKNSSDTYFRVSNGESVVMNNLYYGAGDFETVATNSLIADPKLSFDLQKLKVYYEENSPVFGAGTISTQSIVPTDFFGAIRSNADIGAIALESLKLYYAPPMAPANFSPR